MSLEPYIKENEPTMIKIFHKIFRRRRSAFWVCWVLTVVFMLTAVPGDFSYAQEGKFMREEWRVPDFYPQKGFDGYGKIDRIDKDGVVIDDTVWKFSRQIRFATPRDRHAGISSFSVGDTAAYLLNAEREVTSLWYIEFRK
jgi:hypothetical protein